MLSNCFDLNDPGQGCTTVKKNHAIQCHLKKSPYWSVSYFHL